MEILGVVVICLKKGVVGSHLGVVVVVRVEAEAVEIGISLLIVLLMLTGTVEIIEIIEEVSGMICVAHQGLRHSHLSILAPQYTTKIAV